MEIEDLRTLCAVIECGGITRASEKLCRVPSAVTARIKALEAEFDLTLFQRKNRRMIPTADGLNLSKEASRLVRETDNLVKRWRSREPGGVLRIGALDSIAGTRLARPLAELIRRYPKVNPVLSVDVSGNILSGLREGKLDAGLLIDAPESEEFHRRGVFKETLCLASESDLTDVRTPGDLKHKTVLAYRVGCSYRDRILRWFSLYGEQPSRIIEVSSYSAILAGVAAGMGVAAVPENLAKSAQKEGVVALHPLPEPLGTAWVELVTSAGEATTNVKVLDELLPTVV